MGYAAVRDEASHAGLAARETGPADAPRPRLLDRVRAAIRARHYSRRTEEVYVAWIRRYIVFHGKRHPAEMGAPEITRFLSSLACCRLRVQDVDFAANQIVVRGGKGDKDRVDRLT